MSWPAETNAFAIACGVGGAFVDVSDYVLFDEGGITRLWGPPSQFDSVRPGQFSVTLDNSDGRFTPGNTVFATPLVEGMSVVWQLNGRLVEGTIASFAPTFADVANAETARMRVTCDDVLGRLARTRLLPLADQLVDAAGTFGFWKFDDDVTSSVAVDSGPLGLPPFRPASASVGVTFGAEGLPWADGTQARLGQTPGTSLYHTNGISRVFDYSATSGGAFGFWVEVITPPTTSEVFFDLFVARRDANDYLRIRLVGASADLRVGAGATPSGTGLPSLLGGPHYVMVDVAVAGADVVHTVYVDGVSFATRSYAHSGRTSAADLSPTFFQIDPAAGVDVTDYRLARLSHTRRLADEYLARDATTLAGVINYIEGAADGVTFDTLPDLWDAPVLLGDIQGSSALDLLNEALTTEQGYVYPVTSGTLTNPTTVLKVRRRDRPETADHTFTTTTDILGQPDMNRDLANTVSTVNVQGPTQTVQVVEPSLLPIVGQASRNEPVPLVRDFDLRAWGQDRIDRGTNIALDVREFTVDAQGTDTDRWDDLLSMIPGDRVRVAGLPSTQLGFATFDGWLVGGREAHTAERNLFTMRLARALPAVAKYDTALYMASGELTLNSGINSSVTSISVASTGALLSTTNTPYTMQIGSEQMTVTAVSGSSSPQTVTVTRGVNGSTAASHSSGAVLVGPIPVSLYAF